MSQPIRFSVNGRPVTVVAQGAARLVDVLREELDLIGTKVGCGEGECGACTVLLDGQPVMSCLVPMVQVEGTRIETIEGVAGAALHPVQQTFIEHGATQCGICTPGIIMTLVAHLRAGGAHDEPALREALAGNLCRCTGYSAIITAAAAAAVAMRAKRPADGEQA